MERIVPGAQDAARRRADLVGTPVFWLTIAVTLCALVPFALFPEHAGVARLRSSADVGMLLHRQRDSLAPHALDHFGAGLSCWRPRCSPATRRGSIAVDIWMVWVLGAGIIAANLSERFVGKYL